MIGAILGTIGGVQFAPTWALKALCVAATLAVMLAYIRATVKEISPEQGQIVFAIYLMTGGDQKHSIPIKGLLSALNLQYAAFGYSAISEEHLRRYLNKLNAVDVVEENVASDAVLFQEKLVEVQRACSKANNRGP